MRHHVAIALAATLVMVSAPAAHAQRGAATTEQIDALKRELGELRAQTVEIPTLAASVQDLSARLAALEQELGKLGREQKAIPDALLRLDGLDEKLSKLAAEIEATRTQLATMERPEPSSSGGGVTYSSGYRWTTADGLYSIGISGYLDARYQLELAGGEIDTSTLSLKDARVGLSGTIASPALSYKILLSGLHDKPLLEYFADYMLRKELGIRFGQYKTQLARGFITSSTDIAFPVNSIALDALRYDRDIQVGLLGELAGGRVGYYLGVGNGAGRNKVDDNLDMNATMRVDVVLTGERFTYTYGDFLRSERPAVMAGVGAIHDLTPMPAEIGPIAINTDVDGDGDRDNVRVISASADIIARYRGFEATVEAIWRQESYGSILQHPDNAALVRAIGGQATRSYLGVYGHASYFLPMNVLVGGRVGYAELPFLGLTGRSTTLPGADSAIELDALVQHYNHLGSRSIGLQYSLFDYRNDSGEEPTGIIDHRLVLETQLRF